MMQHRAMHTCTGTQAEDSWALCSACEPTCPCVWLVDPSVCTWPRQVPPPRPLSGQAIIAARRTCFRKPAHRVGPACCSVPVQVSRPCQAHSDLLGHRRQLLAAAMGVEPCPPLPLLSTVQGSDSLAEMAQPAGRGGAQVCRRHAAPPRVVLQGQPPGAAGPAPAAHRQLCLLLPGGPLLHAGLPGCCWWPPSMMWAPQGPGQGELQACLPACLPGFLNPSPCCELSLTCCQEVLGSSPDGGCRLSLPCSSYGLEPSAGPQLRV